MKRTTALILTLILALSILPSYALDIITYVQNASVRLRALSHISPLSTTHIFSEKDDDLGKLHFIGTCAGWAYVNPDNLEIVKMTYYYSIDEDIVQSIRDGQYRELIAGITSLEKDRPESDEFTSIVDKHPLKKASEYVDDWLNIAEKEREAFLTGEERIMHKSSGWTYSCKLLRTSPEQLLFIAVPH